MKAAWLLPLLLLGGCGGTPTPTPGEQQTKESKINQDIKSKGYAEVGKLPNGKKIYMMYVSNGWGSDIVYFTQDNLSPIGDCGKNCTNGQTLLE